MKATTLIITTAISFFLATSAYAQTPAVDSTENARGGTYIVIQDFGSSPSMENETYRTTHFDSWFSPIYYIRKKLGL